ncbi:BMP family ABC transporter substrate-binding protein [Clostridium tagluense]|uniref:ABC transporter substrate-binding protein PnrA-like domain-containing protein n=1 Tax=Clostridium tagluense TaxID=360422 RepID=A0A401UNR2_9CLOT|nr:BMP family ABC transporter substrate-binding protein [Clostridium tagluense]GCD11183.1 hypothetical protein Ctaglu_28060 [Clostridium tagluense]
MNFLPLAGEDSEFSTKWQAVYAHHINDGINDTIKMYEYMNEFYVMEGNKRVSVLKYVDAYAIEGEITRLVPKRDEMDLNNKIYYEFLDFNNNTGINAIWFTCQGSFTQLGKYLDEYNPKLTLFSNKYKHFLKNVYSPFRNIFYELGGDKLNITTGDAFLEYIKIYGISDEFIETKRKSCYLNITLRAALKYDNIKFFNCSPVKAFRNVSTYFGRSHEPRFLMGLIAGTITKSNIIGYIDIYNAK